MQVQVSDAHGLPAAVCFQVPACASELAGNAMLRNRSTRVPQGRQSGAMIPLNRNCQSVQGCLFCSTHRFALHLFKLILFLSLVNDRWYLSFYLGRFKSFNRLTKCANGKTSTTLFAPHAASLPAVRSALRSRCVLGLVGSAGTVSATWS